MRDSISNAKILEEREEYQVLNGKVEQFGKNYKEYLPKGLESFTAFWSTSKKGYQHIHCDEVFNTNSKKIDIVGAVLVKVENRFVTEVKSYPNLDEALRIFFEEKKKIEALEK